MSPESIGAVCDQILARAAPFRLALAASDDDRLAVYHLRCRCLIEEGWARAEDFPDGLERDRWDGDAVHIAAWDGPALAGTVRLVTPAPGRRLPIEEAFELELEPAGEVVDGGRLVVAPAYRALDSHKVLALLFARFWLEASGRGFQRIAAAAPSAVAALYRRLGLQVEILGPPRRHWGEERSPLLIGGTAAAFAAARR